MIKRGEGEKQTLLSLFSPAHEVIWHFYVNTITESWEKWEARRWNESFIFEWDCGGAAALWDVHRAAACWCIVSTIFMSSESKQMAQVLSGSGY